MSTPDLLRRFARSAAAGALLAMAAGCAGDPSFPSLAPRAVEDESLAEPSLPAPPTGTPDAAAMAEYAPLVDKARADDAQFRAALSEARGALAAGRGASTGSDAWLAAQAALSRVAAARYPVATALADLDAARNGDAPRTDSGKAAAVARAFETVRTIDAAEDGALAAALPPE